MKNQTKVVMRHLPPCLTEDEFIKIVGPLPSHGYFKFFTADPTLGMHGTSRAYIDFNTLDSLFQFKEQFDNYIFIDSKGNESVGMVEYAVCQAIPTPKDKSSVKRRVDSKQGTIFTDPDYETFVKQLEAQRSGGTGTGEATEGQPAWEANLEEIKAREKDTEGAKVRNRTHLIEYISQMKSDQFQERQRREEERQERLAQERKREARNQRPVGGSGWRGNRRDKNPPPITKDSSKSGASKRDGASSAGTSKKDENRSKKRDTDSDQTKPIPKSFSRKRNEGLACSRDNRASTSGNISYVTHKDPPLKDSKTLTDQDKTSTENVDESTRKRDDTSHSSSKPKSSSSKAGRGHGNSDDFGDDLEGDGGCQEYVASSKSRGREPPRRDGGGRGGRRGDDYEDDWDWEEERPYRGREGARYMGGARGGMRSDSYQDSRYGSRGAYYEDDWDDRRWESRGGYEGDWDRDYRGGGYRGGRGSSGRGGKRGRGGEGRGAGERRGGPPTYSASKRGRGKPS